MATGAIVAGAIGAGMAAAGTGAAIRAARLKAQPRRVYFGGSADAYNGLTEGYADEVDQAAGRTDVAVQSLSGAGSAGVQLAQRGAALLDSAGSVGQINAGTRGMSLLDAYQPGEASRAAAQAASDTAGRQNLAAGRTGGALGLRSALYANANAGQQVAQQAAVQRTQEEQALLAAKVGQANADRQTLIDTAALAESQRLARAQTGAQIAATGNGQAITAAGQTAQVGLAGQNLYQDALQSTQDRQFQADLDYEQRRQAERQRRGDRLWQLGGSLISGGASIATSGIGGKGGK